MIRLGKGFKPTGAVAEAPGALAILLLSAWLLGGCASPSSTPISLGEQGQGQLIDCGGFGLSARDCVEMANEVCESDYEVVASSGQWHSGAGVASVLKDMERGMVIRCLDP